MMFRSNFGLSGTAQGGDNKSEEMGTQRTLVVVVYDSGNVLI